MVIVDSSNDNTIHDGSKSTGTAGIGTGEGNRNTETVTYY